MKAAPTQGREARGLRIAILRALFNPEITDGLLQGAQEASRSSAPTHAYG